MKTFPPVPDVVDAPSALFEGGHLWIQEFLDGSQFRVQLLESGLLRFGDSTRVWTDEVPDAYEHAARHVRERLDREALRSAVDDVESVVFFGVAMHRRRLEYDWVRTPSFLGFGIWSARRGRFLPPDVVENVYDRLGLDTVNAFEQERRAVDVTPERYTVPDSAWRDGPAAGVVFLNKTGDRAKLLHPALQETPPSPTAATAADLAREATDDDRLARIVSALRADDVPVTFETVYDRALEVAVRAHHRQLFGDGAIDRRAFRSEVAARVREYVSTHT